MFCCGALELRVPIQFPLCAHIDKAHTHTHTYSRTHRSRFKMLNKTECNMQRVDNKFILSIEHNCQFKQKAHFPEQHSTSMFAAAAFFLLSFYAYALEQPVAAPLPRRTMRLRPHHPLPLFLSLSLSLRPTPLVLQRFWCARLATVHANRMTDLGVPYSMAIFLVYSFCPYAHMLHTCTIQV